MTVREQADTGMEELARWVEEARRCHIHDCERAVQAALHGRPDPGFPLLREALTRWADKVRREQLESEKRCVICRWTPTETNEILVDGLLHRSCASHIARGGRVRAGEPPDEKREE
jgi:hypothetical protein